MACKRFSCFKQLSSEEISEVWLFVWLHYQKIAEKFNSRNKYSKFIGNFNSRKQHLQRYAFIQYTYLIWYNTLNVSGEFEYISPPLLKQNRLQYFAMFIDEQSHLIDFPWWWLFETVERARLLSFNIFDVFYVFKKPISFIFLALFSGVNQKF